LLLFVDESGHDEQESPFSVLAGLAIRERDLWNFTRRIRDLESAHFGLSLSEIGKEIKAKDLLNRKKFKHANYVSPIPLYERTLLCSRLLREGHDAKLEGVRYMPFQLGLAAYGQTAIAFSQQVLEECSQFQVTAFLTLVPRGAPKPSGGILRKDYAYLFERYFYFLESTAPNEMGLVVFDELEKSKAHILLDQMHYYFSHFSRGRTRASRIIPVPFFVHSDLTVMIQVADLVAYIANWAIRFGSMSRDARSELEELAQLVWGLRWQSAAFLPDPSFQGSDLEPDSGVGRILYSFCFIPDLRPQSEKAL
jgi:hypothetical protein